MKRSTLIFFFHGLNTYGDADVHIGPVRLGAMTKNWSRAMSMRHPEIQFHALSALGSQSLADQAVHATTEIRTILANSTSEISPQDLPLIHFLGQSTGGLVARLVAEQESFRDQVRSIVTIGTPHHGSAAAEFALKTALADSTLSRGLKPLAQLIKYDVDQKTRIFQELTRASLQEFNDARASKSKIPCYSIPCVIERSKIAWPLQFLYSWVHQEMPPPSDGFISLASQIQSPETNASLPFLLENFELDHYSELGYCLAPRSQDRAQAVKEFDRLVEVVVQIVSCRNDLAS